MDFKKVARSIVESKYLDVFGAFLVLVVSISKGYHQTVYTSSGVEFGLSWIYYDTFLGIVMNNVRIFLKTIKYK